MLHRSEPLRFQCTGCGRCCFGGEDHYVRASVSEAERIRHHLGVSSDWFRRRYVQRLDDGDLGIRMRDGRCIFLGDDLRCTLYALRPVQCRTYPFWPELVGSRRAWRAEARRCEGIDRGEPVEESFVERQLRRQIRSEPGDR